MTPEYRVPFILIAIFGFVMGIVVTEAIPDEVVKPVIVTERVEVKDTTWWPRHANEYNVVRYEFSDTTCSVVETLIERGEK